MCLMKVSYAAHVDDGLLTFAAEAQLEHAARSDLDHDARVKLDALRGRHLDLDGRERVERRQAVRRRDHHAWYGICVQDLRENTQKK